MVKCAHRIVNHLQNADKLASEHAASRLGLKIALKEAAFLKERSKFKAIKPVVELVKDLKTPRERRKFLVLSGPSRTGKTQFVKSLFGTDATLEVNCAGEEHPTLADFQDEKHRVLLLDEASPTMVGFNRKLFQAPNALVQVAQSKTSCHSYSVYLNDTLIVICSNSWATDLLQCSQDVREWIQANQVLITVTRPLWISK